VNLSQHFSLAEFTASQTAAREGIDNDLPADLLANARRTAEMLERIRAALGYALAAKAPSLELVALLLALPWAYAGLRQIGKGVDAMAAAKR
jgi:hypothetical protein